MTKIMLSSMRFRGCHPPAVPHSPLCDATVAALDGPIWVVARSSPFDLVESVKRAEADLAQQLLKDLGRAYEA
jgi:hypothetical protein